MCNHSFGSSCHDINVRNTFLSDVEMYLICILSIASLKYLFSFCIHKTVYLIYFFCIASTISQTLKSLLNVVWNTFYRDVHKLYLIGYIFEIPLFLFHLYSDSLICSIQVFIIHKYWHICSNVAWNSFYRASIIFSIIRLSSFYLVFAKSNSRIFYLQCKILNLSSKHNHHKNVPVVLMSFLNFIFVLIKVINVNMSSMMPFFSTFL